MVEFSCLRRIPLFANLRDDQLVFAQHGVERWLEPNEILAAEGDPAGYFWVLVEGEIHCTKRVGDRQVPWITYQPNSYFGHELILLDRPVLATAQALSRCRMIEFDTTAFWKMLELCPSVTRDLMVVTTQRSQNLDALSLRTQKLMSLGTLTSGLAQELYQPAQTSRAALQKLKKKFELLQSLALRITHTLTPDQQTCLIEIQQDVLRQGAIALAQHPGAINEDLDTQSEQVAEVEGWLQTHGVSEGPYRDYLASTLVKVGLGTAWLDKITAVPDCAFADVLLWVATTLTGMIQVDEIERSTLHISQLVQAAKDYTYLDQAPLQEMDIHDGLENTLRVLNHRLSSQVTIVRDYDRSLPPICVYGSDLNQVWTHLIENAIDAMSGEGQLQIRTFRLGEYLVVEIIDDGPGIPAEAQPHIFKQFFTTKGGGGGTGLGLPIAQRVIEEQHRGHIVVDSQPGHTCFRVSLPMNLTETLLMSPSPQFAYP